MMAMEKIGPYLRKLRQEKGDSLNTVADYMQIDVAILSKIERGKRKVQRKHVDQLSPYFDADKKSLLISWLSSRILEETENEKYAIEALEMALKTLREENVRPLNREIIIHQISSYLQKDGRIKRAWVYGRFVNDEDNIPESVDIMLEESDKNAISYFDLEEIQNDLENVLSLKIKIAFTSTLSGYVVENLMKEAVLIYEHSKDAKK